MILLKKFLLRHSIVIFLLLLLVFLPSNMVLADNLSAGIDALKKNNLSKALDYFTAALEENKKDPSRLYYLGLTLKKMGDSTRSTKAFYAALQQNPPAALAKQIQFQITAPTSNTSNGSGIGSNTSIRQRQNTDSSALNYLKYVTPDGQVKRWDLNKMPLKVYIAPGNNIPNYSPQYRQMVINALNTWQNAMQNKLRFITTTDAPNANIKVTWINSLKGMEIGVSPFVSIKDVIMRSDVDLSTSMPDGTPKSASEMYFVALHELGHALGLQGHSPDPHDIMYYALNQQNYNTSLTQRDINTIKMLYNLQATVSNSLPLSMENTKLFYKYQLMASKAYASNDFKNALNYNLAALKIYSKDFSTQFDTGVCYSQLQDHANAMIHFEAAKALNPNDTLVNYNLAIAQVRYGVTLENTNSAKAKEYYTKALGNLQIIQNKPNKPPDTDTLLSEVKAALGQ